MKHTLRLFNLFVVAAMLVVALPAPAVTTNLASAAPESQNTRTAFADAKTYLLLRSGAFDPAAGEPAFPAELHRTLVTGQPGLRLVQFPGPIHDEWYQALTKAGLQVVTYMPDYAYLVWGDEAGVKKLESDTPVRWAGAYHPFYTLHPALADSTKLPAEVEVIVQVYDHPGADGTVQAILSQAKQILRAPQQVLTYRNLGVRIATDKLTWLASLPEVVNVEPRPQYQKLDEVQGQIMAGNLNAAGTQPTGPGYLAWLTNHGFPPTAESYPIVDVTDDGIDNGTNTPLHPDFYTLGLTSTVDRLIYNVNWTSDPAADGLAGHGNLNASIVAGYNDKTGLPYEDGNGFNYGLGISPYGRVAGSKVFNNSGSWDLAGDNYTALISQTYALGGHISSNSWGAPTGGAYTSDDQAYDALVRDAQPGTGAYAGNQEIAIVFSAGNAGSGSNTTDSPGNAKNVVTVGAAENYRPTWTDGCGIAASGADNAQDIISFSSRGPTDDQRVKPDIVAPGTHIEGAASQDPGYTGSGVCDQYMPVGQTLYAASSGTSHSAPAIAGAASLVHYYYQNRFGSPPSPAMTKAYLVNATRYLTGTSANDNLPSNNQGYGEIYLEQAFNNANRMVVDQGHVLADSGQVYEVQGSVPDAAQPFHVTLVWTDAPGPTTGNAYVNNLDLEVIVNGQTYKGNIFSGGTSTTGGTADPRNNVESVFLPAGTIGSFTVRVIATNIAGDGVPGNSDPTDQDFALVIYNGSQVGFGYLTGAVTDSTTSAGLVGVAIQAASSPTQTNSTTSGSGGMYAIALFTNTYTVTASTYGYLPASISSISVISGTTTTLNFALDPAPTYVVSGTVTDSTTGWPLYTSIAIAGSGYPGGTIWTNPVTGYYSVTLAGGITLTFNVNAWVTGYLPADVQVAPLTSNQTVNIGLTASPDTCNAPGYGIAGGLVEKFDSVTAPALPSGWATAPVTGTASWATSVGTRYPSGNPAHSAPNVAYFNSYTAISGNSARLYRASGLNITTLPTTTLSFWIYHDLDYSSNNDRVQVQASTDTGATWSNVGAPISRYNGTTGWAQHTVSLSAYADQTDLWLGFLGISGYGNDVHIDDVALGSPACVAQVGGLVVGSVYDLNTGDPLAGATVANDSGHSATTLATTDPAVPDSFYTLFSPAGAHVFTATQNWYGPAVMTPTVVQSHTIQQDFNLPAGRLSFAPPAMEATLTQGFSTTLPLTLSNTGGVSLSFELRESLGGFGEDVLVVRHDTTAANAMQEALTANGYTFLGVTDAQFQAMTVAQLLTHKAVFHAGTTSSGTAPGPSEILLMAYLDAGGSLYISDNDLGFYRYDSTFYGTYLQATFVSDNPFITTLIGQDVMAGLTLDISSDPYPDDFTVGAQGTRLFQFQAGNAAGLKVAHDAYKAVYTSFDFQYGGSVANQTEVVQRIMQFFTPDVTWLRENPITGTIAAPGAQVVSVTFDAGVPEVTQPGTYTATLTVRSNDPVNSNRNIAVTMTVNAPATYGTLQGTVTGLLRCDAPGSPLSNTTILVEASTGLTWTLTTNVTGTYQLWLDVTNSPLTLTVSHAGYLAQTRTSVSVTVQQTTQNFDLRLLAPCVSVTPGELTSAQRSDVQITRTLNVNNTGVSGATWSVAEAIPWLSALPISGTVGGDSSSAVVATFDSTGLPSGVYTGSLTVDTDDPDLPSVLVPVTMTIQNLPSCSFTSSSPDDLGQVTVFTNTTTGDAPLTYRWNLGDGSPINAAVNPTHTYAHAGMYTIVLTAENMMGMDVCFGTVSIEGIEAGFTSNSPVALGSPVVFTNTTLANPAVITWVWDLGDSTVSTAQTPPPHVYPGEGSYTVTLSAVSIKGSSTYTGTAMVVAFWPHHIYLPITLRQ